MLKTKKFAILLAACLSVFAIILPTPAAADIGPKPSVVVQFEGLSGETYYVTLLSKSDSTGPYSADTPHEHISMDEGDLPVWQKFWDYADSDGYYFINFLLKANDTDKFVWGYYPPSDFKILIYLPRTDTFISSAPLKRYAFDSYYTASVDMSEITLEAVNDYSFQTEKGNDIWPHLLSFAARLVGTLAIEILLALAFGFTSKKQLKVLFFANLATQVLLNAALSVIIYFDGLLTFSFYYILFEIIVTAAEALIYAKFLPPDSKKPQSRVWFIILYAVAANLLSFAVGTFLAYFSPEVF